MVLPLGDVERTRIVPLATYLLIALNVAIFVLQQQQGDEFTATYAATPYEITHGEDLTRPEEVDVATPGQRARQVVPHGPISLPVWVTLLTALFLHGSPLHLAGNLLYLWIFGDNVEEVLGTFRYLVVYFACGVMGMVAQIAANPESHIPTLGASGAIAGIMGIYVIWFPRNHVRVLVLRFVTEMPAVVVIGGWIGLQVLEGLNAFGHVGRVGGVAYLAHAGGAATGVAVAFLFGNLSREHALRSEEELIEEL